MKDSQPRCGENKQQEADATGTPSSSFDIRQVSTTEELKLCQAMRLQAFVEEQKIPKEVELDGQDESPHAIHVLGYDSNNQPVATGRLMLLPPCQQPRTTTNCTVTITTAANDQMEAVLGRIVVIASRRGQGWGARVVQRLEEIAASRGVQRITLTPHHYLQPFYERLGYQQILSKENHLIWVNEQCQLITMEKDLSL